MKDQSRVKFSDQLANVLGFREQSIQRAEVTARHRMDAFPGLNFMMLCTNFIEESFLGDAKVPLLRMLPLQSGTLENHIMSYECYPIQYKKVLQRELDSIRILLVDDTGRKLPFTDRGRVALTLHFRKNGSLPTRQYDEGN